MGGFEVVWGGLVCFGVVWGVSTVRGFSFSFRSHVIPENLVICFNL